MKSVVATIGMMAAVASAYSPGRNLHFPRGNGTSSAAGDAMTTLTVKTTEIHTITSCAPTVTNCPAHPTGIASLPESDKTTMIVTNTVVLTETVCPVSEAPGISSSVIAKHQSGGLTGVTLAPTTVSKAIHPTGKPSMTTKVTDVVSDKTVTMTMGSGKDKTTTTSVVHVTVQKTVTVPCDESSVAPTNNGGENTGAQNTGGPTTTTTATTKVTRTVTVKKNTPTNGPGNGGDSTGKGECPASCAATTVTETVTAPASTVYVTIGGSAPANTDSGSKPAAVTNPPTVDNSGNDKGNDNKGKSSSECTEDITSTIQKVVTVVPYPKGNDTKPTSGSAQPSGFARLVR